MGRRRHTPEEIAQAIEGSIHDNAQPAGLAHWDHRDDVARLHHFANLVGVKASIIRCFTRCDVRPHGQACAIDAEMDLGRKATS